jgi:hypothetical protein
VLGRQPIDNPDRILARADQDGGPVIIPSPPGDLVGVKLGELAKLAFDLTQNRVRQPLVRGDEYGRGGRTVLGLSHQVGRHQLRIGCLVGQHGDLRRTRQQVDADPSEELALGLGHEHVPRPDEPSAAQIERALTQRAVRQRRRAIRRYSWPSVIDRTERVIGGVLGS